MIKIDNIEIQKKTDYKTGKIAMYSVATVDFSIGNEHFHIVTPIMEHGNPEMNMDEVKKKVSRYLADSLFQEIDGLKKITK